MRVGIFGKEFKQEFDEPVKLLIQELTQNGVELSVYHRFAEFLKARVDLVVDTPTFTSASVVDMDLLISIGGDGSLLDTVKVIKDAGIPILGVNTGRLGFLSNVSIDTITESVMALVDRKYTIDNRELIHVTSPDEDFRGWGYALNEATLHKKDSSSMITVKTWVNDIFMNAYWADGLIVSTPTGSTAYSLSCGGPIVMPGSRNFIFTPIAPHNLNVRPMVIPSDNNVVKLKAEGRGPNHLLTLDSRSFTLPADTVLEIRSADFEISLVNLPGQHFFHTIRKKLNWGIDQRN
jgi:NAD+ kinase